MMFLKHELDKEEDKIEFLIDRYKKFPIRMHDWFCEGIYLFDLDFE